MLYGRKAEKDLTEWAQSDRRKPLIIRGARQVGKSTLVRKFGQTFDHFIELNLEAEQTWVDAFEASKSVDDFMQVLKLRLRIKQLDGRVLLFIDEIQNSPKAIFLLRYFYEKLPELYVIAAGSLLEFAMGKVKSFPVGRVQFYYLGPLDFEEFLHWKGEEMLLEVYKKTPVPDFATVPLFEAYNQFIIVGGMPEAVQEYLENGSLGGLPAVYDTIWRSYVQDIDKYAKNQQERRLFNFLMQNVPFQEGRITFRGFANSSYQSREVAEALRTMENTRVLSLHYPSTSTEVPLAPDFKKSPKLQLLDTGLLIHALGVQADVIGLDDLQTIFNGRLVEHHLIQEYATNFRLQHHVPRFWVRQKAGSNAEVDLLYQYEAKVFPVEIKAGPQGRLRSLHQFVERSSHPYAIRFLRNNFSVEKHTTPAGKPYYLMNLPYFLMGRIEEYVKYFLEKYPQSMA